MVADHPKRPAAAPVALLLEQVARAMHSIGHNGGLFPAQWSALRYFRDANFRRRVLAPPVLASGRYADVPVRRPDDWSTLPIPVVPAAQGSTAMDADAVVDDGGLRRQPELADEGVYLSPTHAAIDDSALLDDDDTLPRPSRVDPRLQRNARVAALDPADGIAL